MGSRAFNVDTVRKLIAHAANEVAKDYEETHADAIADYMDEVDGSLIERFKFYVNKGRYKLRNLPEVSRQLDIIRRDSECLLYLNELVKYADDGVVYLSGRDIMLLNKYCEGACL